MSGRSKEELEALVKEQGDKVRKLKEDKAEPAAIKEAVGVLLALKKELDPEGAAAGKKKGGGGLDADTKARKAAEKKAKQEARVAEKLKKQQEQAAAQAESRARKEKKRAEAKAKKGEDDDPEYVDPTVKGEKKDLSAPMRKAYEPATVECSWYEWWEASGKFKPPPTATEGKQPFTITIPPPNVTGALHIGHALTNSLEDTIVRWHRMRGEDTLWLPATDHAGIATQTVVEKMLMKTSGQTRHDLGREAFVEKVWEWKKDYGNRITTQLRRLGSSLDWERESFTMDERLSVAVGEAFVRLYDRGLIYRQTRLINWSSKLNTAISDIEVEYITIDKRTEMSVPGHTGKYPFGYLLHFAYKVENSDEEIVVATTRIETMLGDTAVAVHPDDPRYEHLVGKNLVHPFVDRLVPIIADPIVVDMSFGTGAVKITPAHDPNDYTAGQRNNLEMISVLNDDGSMNDKCGEFSGMMRFDARLAVTAALKEKGLWREETNNPMRLQVCSRSGDIIEPRLKPQWWVNCEKMAKRAADAVRNPPSDRKEDKLNIVPESFNATWFSWLDNIRDWCISRQLWWGHRIPAYMIVFDGESPDENNADNFVVGRSEAEARERAEAKFPGKSFTLQQDPDVLDTWFSSGLFPFSPLGWPNEKADDYARFFPTSLLETGHDILFFWVARMVMLSLELTDKLPFTDVFLHGMVRDAHGRKMSKTLGNVIDPIDVIEGISLPDLQAKLLVGNLSEAEVEKAKAGLAADYPEGIPACGTDALRLTLASYTTQGRDINLDIARVVANRAFCNKMWNATRLVLMSIGSDYKAPAEFAFNGSQSMADRWIMSRLNKAVTETNAHFEAYGFAEATQVAQAFFLNDYCDVYLELSKPIMRLEDSDPRKQAARDVLYTVMDNGLRLLAPFMPFVTEELWQRLGRRAGDETESIHVAPYPEGSQAWADEAVEVEMEQVKALIKAFRSLRADYNITKAQPAAFALVGDENIAKILAKEADNIQFLARVDNLQVMPATGELPDGCGMNVIDSTVTAAINLKGAIDIGEEMAKLEKQLAAQEASKAKIEKSKANPNYEKIPEKVRNGNEERLVTLAAEIESLCKAMESLKALA